MYTCTNTETGPPHLASVLASVSKLFPSQRSLQTTRRENKPNVPPTFCIAEADGQKRKEKKKERVRSSFQSKIFHHAHDSAVSCLHRSKPRTMHLFSRALTSLPGEAARRLSQLFLFSPAAALRGIVGDWSTDRKKCSHSFSNHIRKMKECHEKKKKQVPAELLG